MNSSRLQRFLNGLVLRPARLWVCAVLWVLLFAVAFANVFWRVRILQTYRIPVRVESASSRTARALVVGELANRSFLSVRVGDSARIALPSGRTVAGTIVAVRPAASVTSVTIRLDDDQALPEFMPGSDAREAPGTVGITLRARRLIGAFLGGGG